MGLFNTLVQTYDKNAAAINDFGGHPLIPVSHMSFKMQLEITIDSDGNFISAKEVDKDNASTVIPVTEDSGGRSSGVAAHPLEDSLSYIAGDYLNYVNKELQESDFKKKTEYDKAIKKLQKNLTTLQQKHEAYLNLLSSWKNSTYTTKKVDAIYAYIIKNSTIADLIKSGLVKTENGVFTEDKIAGAVYEKCMTRFRVLGTSLPEECWQDLDLMKAYADFYEETFISKKNDEQVSFVTGEKQSVTYKHPKGSVASAFGAKLLSSNDATDFTFRGRFLKPEQAYSVDYESSQKAHHALQWLTSFQGKTIGTNSKRTFVIWSTSGEAVDDVWSALEDEDDYYPTTDPEKYLEVVNNIIKGKRTEFHADSKIAFVTLEAATTGRLSVTYYGELTVEEYFRRLQSWYDSCAWLFWKKQSDGSSRKVITNPDIRTIVNCTFGHESTMGLETDDKLFILQFQRILHCILDEARISYDLINTITNKCSNPLSYGKKYNRENVLDVACALIHKYYTDRGRKIEMSLDRSEMDKNYLYGRLLAVYEAVENTAIYKDEDKSGRETNAIRLQSSYAQHPAVVRRSIEEALIPYFAKLTPGSKEFYRHEIGQISDLIGIDKGNHPLNELYLVGYWAEREALRYGHNTQKEDK